MAIKINFCCDQKRRKSSSALLGEVTSSILEFYLRDDISRQAPGKKDAITIREGRLKSRVQKRHVTMSLMEAYALFKEEFPEVTVGK